LEYLAKLPSHFTNISSVNILKNNLDSFWSKQAVTYNFRCDITAQPETEVGL